MAMPSLMAMIYHIGQRPSWSRCLQTRPYGPLTIARAEESDAAVEPPGLSAVAGTASFWGDEVEGQLDLTVAPHRGRALQGPVRGLAGGTPGCLRHFSAAAMRSAGR